MTLAERWLDGDVSDEEVRRLNHVLCEDPAVAHELVAAAVFESELKAIYQRPSSQRLGRMIQHAQPTRGLHGVTKWAWWGGAVAATVAAAIGVVAITGPTDQAHPQQDPQVYPRWSQVSDPSESQAVAWAPGVDLIVAPGGEVREGSAGWPLVMKGRVRMVVDPAVAQASEVSLRDSRIAVVVTGTDFVLDSGDGASLVAVASGHVATTFSGGSRHVHSGGWLLVQQSLAVAGRGPSPSTQAAVIAAGTTVGDGQRVQLSSDTQSPGWSIDCGSVPPGDGLFGLFAGISVAIPQHPHWHWAGQVELPSAARRAQAALRFVSSDGEVLWRITIARHVIAVSRGWPDYAVHAETTVEPVVGKAAYSVSLIDGALTIHRNGDPVLATAIPVDWQRPAVLEMVAQGHRADGAASGAATVTWSDVVIGVPAASAAHDRQ